MKNYVAVVGAVNIDISGTPYNKLIKNDSNPGYVKSSLGGVGRNIAENLARLNSRVELITVLGDDFFADQIIENCFDNNIGINHSKTIENARTSLYLCINDDHGEMNLALSDMDLYNNMSLEFLESKLDFLNNSRSCVIDTNIPRESIEFLANNLKVPLFIDTVSVNKTKKILDILDKVYALKPNIHEAELLSEIQINTIEDVKKAANIIIKRGVKKLFISMGNKGVYYKDETKEGLLPSLTLDIVNTTGAGDAFFAGIIWSYLNGYDVEESANIGLAASYICLQSQDTVSKNMSIDKINEINTNWRI